MKHLFSVLICGFFVISCTAPRAVYDYDQDVDFQKYSSYAFFPELETGLSQLDERRLLDRLEDELRQKGFSPEESPELYMNVYSDQYQQQNRNNLGVGVGGGGGNVGVGVSGGIPLGGPQTFLRITFDLVDVADDSLIWQAVVESRFNPEADPEQRREQFQKIVKSALEGYPPPKN